VNILILKHIWEVIETNAKESESTMRFDEKLLENLSQNPRNLLHFYDWEQDSATYGCLVNPADYLNLEGVQKRNMALGKRPTGGGIVFHMWDMAFSALVPANSALFSENTLENYAVINRAVLSAVKEFLNESEPEITPTDFNPSDASCMRFCMAQPTKYDVILNGRKVAGAAQRKTKHGFLHQGTISLAMPDPDYLKDILLPGTQVAASMQNNTAPLLGKSATKLELQEAKKTLRSLLYKHLGNYDENSY